MFIEKQAELTTTQVEVLVSLFRQVLTEPDTLSTLVENPRDTLLNMGLADQDIEAVVMYIGQMRGQLDITTMPQAGSWWA